MTTRHTVDPVFASADVSLLLDIAVNEDLGQEGDVSSRAIPAEAACEALLVFRESGVVVGLPLAERVLARIAPESRLEPRVREGARVDAGTTVARIKGPAREVLAAERLMLNFVQRLSGIATATSRFVQAIGELKVSLLDTRKTTPGWRLLAKYAVRQGGGANHRFGLYDQILLKDNHLAMLGGEGAVARIVAQAREAAPGLPIELEVTSQKGALAAAQAGVEIILLDNFTPIGLTRAVEAIREDAQKRGAEPPLLEASGGVNLDTVRQIAESGVDRISVGWITHSAAALDVALDFVPDRSSQEAP